MANLTKGDKDLQIRYFEDKIHKNLLCLEKGFKTITLSQLFIEKPYYF